MRPPVKKSVKQLIAEQVDRDPGFVDVYEETRAEGHLARQLTALREQRGMTQRDLARATGISQPMINRLERAGENPTLATLQKITSALGAIVEISGKQISVRGARPDFAVAQASMEALAATNTSGAIRYLTIHQLMEFKQSAASRINESQLGTNRQLVEGQKNGLVFPQASNATLQASNATLPVPRSLIPLSENVAWGALVNDPAEMLKLYGANAPELVT